MREWTPSDIAAFDQSKQMFTETLDALIGAYRDLAGQYGCDRAEVALNAGIATRLAEPDGFMACVLAVAVRRLVDGGAS